MDGYCHTHASYCRNPQVISRGLDMPIVEMLSENEIRERRAHLLAEVGMSEDQLRERAQSYSLTADEAGVLAEIDGLDFLLGK